MVGMGNCYNRCMLKESGKPFTVSEISALVRNCLEERFGTVEVEGEVTDFRGASAAGHLYFSLKDAQSRIGVVLFAGRAVFVRAKIDNGKKVRVTGKLTAYGGTSRYQIVAANVVDVGVGDLAAQFEELKRRLSAEGLFDESRKRPLPMLPRHIGVVTSPTGSVIRDFVNVLTRRYPNIDILVAPARVQGAGAAEEIANGVRELNLVGQPEGGALASLPPREVIVVMRGGGSMEELWCFNEEVVARAVAESGVPVISGVGHQTDFTICDFAADLRAPTPSAAAELLVRPKADFMNTLSSHAADMEGLLAARLEQGRSRLSAARSNRVFAEPRHLLENFMQRIDGLARAMDTAAGNALRGARERVTAADSAISVRKARFLPEMCSRLTNAESRMAHAAAACLERRRASLGAASRSLSALSPLAVLERGYSITLLENGKALREPAQAAPGTRLTTRLANGEVRSVVEGGAAPQLSPQTAQQAAPHPRRRHSDNATEELALWQ